MIYPPLRFGILEEVKYYNHPKTQKSTNIYWESIHQKTYQKSDSIYIVSMLLICYLNPSLSYLFLPSLFH